MKTVDFHDLDRFIEHVKSNCFFILKICVFTVFMLNSQSNVNLMSFIAQESFSRFSWMKYSLKGRDRYLTLKHDIPE